MLIELLERKGEYELGIKSMYKDKVWGHFEKKYATDLQKSIKNKDFTLITSNCCGGVIYHLLNMRFDSPTINLWIDKKEFCKFSSDLPYYMEQTLRFYQKEIMNPYI